MSDPKKPSFKKTFAVPKLKAEVKAETSLLSPKNLFKAADNNTAKSETVQVQPSSGKWDDSNDVIDKEQDKENNEVGPKKVKSKKSLFQAPCTSDIDKKEAKEELSEKNKKKGTKKSLKEQSNTDSDKPKPKKIKKVISNADDNVDVSKPKKVKKDKESADKTENLSKPKKPKKKKLDSEAQNEAKAGEDPNVQHEETSFEKEVEDDEVKNDDEMFCTEENEKSVFQPAIEIQQNNDDSDESKTELEEKEKKEANSVIQIEKPKASDATSKEPPRSLSDQEYEEIFQAVLDRCNNTSLEEMYDSLNKPVKEKKQKEMKATSEKVTKPKQTKTKKTKEQTQAQVVPTSKKFDKVQRKTESNTDVKVQEEKQLENDCNSDEEQQSEEELDVMEFENVDEVEECQALSQLIPDEVINGLQSLSNTVEPNFQDVNEETPEGSEVDYKLPVQKTPPPKKSKKLENHSSIKKQKLAPKQLNFPKKIEELKKESTKSETKSSKKKLKMDEQVSKKLTKEKEPDKLASKEKSRKKEMQERYLTREKLGTWVQCGDKNCSKWRYLPDCEDPSELPEVWTCNMNTDKRYNSCEADEQNYNEDEHIFTNFAEGSVVWAKMAGFPWWPAMIEIDPDTESYFMLMTSYSMYPSHYHVVFFDDKVSRAWVNATSIRKYTGGIEDDDMTPKPTKGGKGYASFSKDLVKAKTNALLAYDMSVSDRLKNFSFAKRYRGTYGKVYQSDSSQETPKPKKKPKIRKRKVEVIGNGMIDSALEEDDNEEAVLKGIEEVLDAIDDELDAMDEDYEDFKMTEEEENKTNITKHGDEKKKTSKETRQNSRQKPNKNAGGIDKGSKIKNKIKKPKMFTESKEEEEMVLPSTPVRSLKFDSDVFTMDMSDDLPGDSNTTDNNDKEAEDKSSNLESKGKSKLKKASTSPSVNFSKTLSENSISVDEDPVVHVENAQKDRNFENADDSESSQSENDDESEISQNQNEQTVETTNTSKEDTFEENSATHISNDSVAVNDSPDNEESCTNVTAAHGIEMDNRSDEVLSLEQDEQMVPGEEPSLTEEELNLEISNPIEDKHPSQVINRTIAPVTIELAYDSDPFDMEE